MIPKAHIPKALVVEIDQSTVSEVDEILKFLKHEYDLAVDQVAAIQKIEASKYDYVLMEVAIPTRQGFNFPRVLNGLDLLDQIHAATHADHTPIIVMTAHGTDNPDLVVEVMQRGAADYIKKPFPKVGRTLDAIIKSALEQAHQKRNGGNEKPPKPEEIFQGGELTFYPDRVELYGVTIISSNKSAQMWTILRALAQRWDDGRYKSWNSGTLARLVNSGQGSVTGSVRDFRRNATSKLKRELGMKVGHCDVIETANAGYRFNAWITIKNPPPPITEARQDGKQKMEEFSDDPSIQRQLQILALLSSGERLRVPAIQDKLGLSFITAKREVDALRVQGKIEFVGAAKTGYWRKR
ncbi:MAG: response regulator [Phycisphaerales bacterium]|nr:response regulator [Phycisphaerales bacterium]